MAYPMTLYRQGRTLTVQNREEELRMRLAGWSDQIEPSVEVPIPGPVPGTVSLGDLVESLASGGGGGSLALQAHIESPNPHEAWDIQDLTLLFENGMV